MVKEMKLMGYGRDVCRPNKKPVKTIPSFHMIHFIEAGSGFYNGCRLTAGQAFVCRRDQLCHYYPDPTEPWIYSWINVRGTGADALIDALPLEHNTFYWNRSANLDALQKIWHYEKNEQAEELICLSALFQISADVIASKIEPKRDYVSEARRLFQSHYDRGVTVERVADRLGISRAYLRNIFYEKIGKSPQAYLMELRMNRAEVLLGCNYSITEIAAVGYTDVLQFSKVFRKYHGISPTGYRNAVRNI